MLRREAAVDSVVDAEKRRMACWKALLASRRKPQCLRDVAPLQVETKNWAGVGLGWQCGHGGCVLGFCGPLLQTGLKAEERLGTVEWRSRFSPSD